MREGIGHQHAHGAVAEPALLLGLGSGGGLGALAELLGDGPYAGLSSGSERCPRSAMPKPRRSRPRPTETTPFASTAPLLPWRKLASFAAIAIGETGRNYDSFFPPSAACPRQRGHDPAPGAHILLRGRPCGGTCCGWRAPSRGASRADRESPLDRARPSRCSNRPSSSARVAGRVSGKAMPSAAGPSNSVARPSGGRGAFGFQPFIAEQQHGLGQAERGEIRADRRGEDRVGERDGVVVEAASLGPEQNAGALGAVSRAA